MTKLPAALIALAVSIVSVLPAFAADPFCGDGNVDPGENCSTCPDDVQCGFCQTCFNGMCVPNPLCTCGDGVVDPGETCANCIDVQCDPGTTCDDGQCVLECVADAMPMDLVFVMDTSGSMGDEAEVLCTAISSIETDLEALGLDVTVMLLGINNNPPFPFDCLTDNVAGLLGVALHGESWGPATALLSASFPWTSGSRVIVPISDEGPFAGDPCLDPGNDRDSIEEAILAANANGIIVSPIAGTGIGEEECVATLGQDLAAGTGGTWHLSTDGGLANAILDLVSATLCVCTGDFDGDGEVGIADFLVLLAGWGMAGGDVDGDGDTGILDFLLLLSLWGSCP